MALLIKKTGFSFDKVKNFGPGGTALVWENKEKYCIDLKGRKSTCRSGCVGVIPIVKEFHTYRSGENIGMLKFEIAKNREGKWIEKITIPPIWSDLKENQQGYAAVKKDALWGVINKAGEVVVDYQYDLIEVHPIAYRTNKFFRIKKNGKYGFLNEKGQLVVAPRYHKVEFYTSGNIAKAWANDTFWGYIDETGKEFFTVNNKQRP